MSIFSRKNEPDGWGAAPPATSASMDGAKGPFVVEFNPGRIRLAADFTSQEEMRVFVAALQALGALLPEKTEKPSPKPVEVVFRSPPVATTAPTVPIPPTTETTPGNVGITSEHADATGNMEALLGPAPWLKNAPGSAN